MTKKKKRKRRRNEIDDNDDDDDDVRTLHFLRTRVQALRLFFFSGTFKEAHFTLHHTMVRIIHSMIRQKNYFINTTQKRFKDDTNENS